MPRLQDSSHPWRRGDLIGLLVVFALALALRWSWPGVTDFKLDEASASRLAIAFARDGWPPLHGVTSSTGVPTPPNAIWVLALPYFIAPDPTLATAWIALLSALSVAVGYGLAHRYFGAYAALVTGVLHATSPFSVYQARKPWTPGVQPLFAVLAVAAGALGFIEGRRRWQAAHMFLLAFTIGVHFSSLPLALVTASLVLSNWRRVDWRMVALGVAGAAVVTTPLVVGVIQYPNIVMTQDSAVQGHQVRVSGDAIVLTAQSITGYNLTDWAGSADAQLDDGIWYADVVSALYAPLLALGVGGLAYSIWKRREWSAMARKSGIAALVWLFSYVLMFTVQWTPIFPQYFIALWPAPYLVIGAGTAVILARGREAHPRRRLLLAAATTMIALLVAGGQTLMLDNFFTFAAAHQTPGDFGTPLGMKMQGARAALDLLEATGAQEIIVVGEGDRPYQYEGPGAFDVMLHDAPHRFVDGAAAAVLPDHSAVVLLQPGEWPAAAWYRAASEVRARIPLRQDEGEYTLLFYDPAKRDALLAGFTPAQPPTLLGNGARVVAHRWADDGRIQIAWQAEQGPPAQEYHFTVYFFDGAQAVAQADGPSYVAAYWRPGDLIVNWFPLVPPADVGDRALELRAAMYTYPGIERVFAVDEVGNPVADSVLLKKP